MEKIEAKTIGIVCQTPCPHRHIGKSGNVAYCASGTCHECPNFRGQETKFQDLSKGNAEYIVSCAFNEK